VAESKSRNKSPATNPPQVDHEAWLMLLGENAMGKSV